MGLHSNGRLLVLPANVRPGQKGMSVANTLAYYDTETIIAVKSFIVLALFIDRLKWSLALLVRVVKWVMQKFNHKYWTRAGNTKGGSITVPLTSCLTGLESAV
jgi:hypothetical protein